MATSQNPAPAREVVRIPVTRAMKEMASMRNLSIAAYLGELAFTDAVEVRRHKVEPRSSLRVEMLDHRSERGSSYFHRNKRLSAEDCQKIRRMLDGGISLTSVARRFGVALSTVRRTLRQEEDDL